MSYWEQKFFFIKLHVKAIARRFKSRRLKIIPRRMETPEFSDFSAFFPGISAFCGHPPSSPGSPRGRFPSTRKLPVKQGTRTHYGTEARVTTRFSTPLPDPCLGDIEERAPRTLYCYRMSGFLPFIGLKNIYKLPSVYTIKLVLH